ncbi:transposase [Hydrogenovibrio sp. JE_KL2]|uniref:REP-associated tyrosine transposase n=1 Tax=Hydrogenovibrio sp. JE_KL2 TaxID=2651188 RepID=UPI00128B9FF6|nr:transposase [Hydrogenovibrio sp. JE_KL2]MPQ75945.1 transposase [Hydrogenovibrio sp. JE_KL2]
MARLPRFNIPGQTQHVIVRGNNREPIFYANEDYGFYLEKLEEACKKHQCDLHAYVLMTNHVHLLMTPQNKDSLSKAMQMIGRYYVQYFNYSYKRTGTLWEGRYKATLIDSEHYALICYRYIELNPVRANMVEHPSEYPWSSYMHNATGDENKLITPHPLYNELGKDTEQRTQAYRGLFNTMIEEKSIEEIRRSTNKAWVLGSDYFKEKIEKQINRPATPRARGGDRKSKKYRDEINRV